MEERKVTIMIDKKGQYTIEASGMTGTSCEQKTKDLELALGGDIVNEGKTSAYYDGDDSPISLNLGN